MRFEMHPRTDLRIGCEIVDLGAGQTGLTVTATLRRTSDGQYLQSGGGWGASPSNLSLTEPSSANQPGLYSYTVAAADLSPSDKQYIAKITESTFSVLEYVRIVPILGLTEDVMILGQNERMKFLPSAWDSTSKQPTAGTVWTYASSAAFAADTVPDGTGSNGEYDVTATFSGGQLTLFTRNRA